MTTCFTCDQPAMYESASGQPLCDDHWVSLERDSADWRDQLVMEVDMFAGWDAQAGVPHLVPVESAEANRSEPDSDPRMK